MGRGTVNDGSDRYVTYVDFLDSKGAPRLRATLPAVEGDMVGPLLRTSGGIAFATAGGPDQVAGGGVAVVALDGRYAFAKVQGEDAKLDARHIAYYPLGVDHDVVRFLRLRTKPRLGWRIDKTKLPPLVAPPPETPAADAGKPDAAKPRR